VEIESNNADHRILWENLLDRDHAIGSEPRAQFEGAHAFAIEPFGLAGRLGIGRRADHMKLNRAVGDHRFIAIGLRFFTNENESSFERHERLHQTIWETLRTEAGYKSDINTSAPRLDCRNATKGSAASPAEAVGGSPFQSALDFGNDHFHIVAMSVSSSEPVSRGRGRPREFDIAQVLDAAIRVFRERGYHATSVVDLQVATALASGSLYKAFKDKRAVFLAAFDRYVSQRDTMRRSALQNCVTGRDKLRAVLNAYACSSCGDEGRRGCLVVGSAVELAILDDEISGRVKDALARTQAMLGDLIREGQTDASIAREIDADAAARLMLCILQGMRVIGKTDRSRDEMAEVVELAMTAVT